jgi:hypothetical protein
VRELSQTDNLEFELTVSSSERSLVFVAYFDPDDMTGIPDIPAL